jgi:MoaA/NifB/PqqE/SkfB family radical SAM enzyme
MCFNWDGMAARRQAPEHSLDDLERLALSMRVLPQLTLSGGEPLLRDDVHSILKAFYDSAHTRFFSVPTNGLLPEKAEGLIGKFVELCPNGYLNFCLPFHGTEPIHDDIMGVPGSYAKRNATCEVVRKARERHRNVSCVLNCVMSSFNAHEYREIVDLAVNEFADIPLGIAYARGNTHEPEAKEFPLDAYKAMHKYLLERKRAKRGLNPYTRIQDAMSRQYCEFVSGVIEGRIKSMNCRAGKRLLVIYETGVVYPCETLEALGVCDTMPQGDACMGDLHDFGYDLPRLLSGDKARSVLEAIKKNPCTCTHECAVTSSVFHSLREVMILTGRILRI